MSKVILKMSYKNPNFKESNLRNVAHVNYIATRPGVDKTLSASDIENELTKEQAENDKYAQYISERPNSHGLFSEDGVEDLSLIKDELKDSKSFVWRAIVSMKEEDAKELGFFQKDKWQDLIRKQMPEIAEQMGIEIDNLKWVAAIHMEKGHPHAHLMFWEKEAKRTQGKVNPSIIRNIKKGFIDEVFEEERFKLLQEKNAMRDLLKELATDDVSALVKGVKELECDIKTYAGEVNAPGVCPRMYSDYEQELIQMIANLSSRLPNRGRIAYEYMPKETKQEIDRISEYILNKDAFRGSLERGLCAAGEMARLYTGNEDQIQKAKDNAYRDIQKRVSQIIIRGAVELQKSNRMVLNRDLAEKAVNFIDNMKESVDHVAERKQVLNKIANCLVKQGCDENEVRNLLFKWAEKKNLGLNVGDIGSVIRESCDKPETVSSIGKKEIERYIGVSKTLDCSEEETFKNIHKIIARNSIALEKELNGLVEKGMLVNVQGKYKLTDLGIKEFLKIKELDVCEKEIIGQMLEGQKANFEDLVENGNILNAVVNTDPKEFEVGKYDMHIYKLFFEDTPFLKIKDIDRIVSEKYTNAELEKNFDNIEKEIGFLKDRLNKLAINGYVQLNKTKQEYSFSEEGMEALEKVEKGMSFTRYDADVTMGYIDKAEGILSDVSLRELCFKETVNKTLENELFNYEQLLENEKIIAQYISVDTNGNIDSTKLGKKLSVEMMRLQKYLFKTDGTFEENKVRQMCVSQFGESKGEKEYRQVMDIFKRALDQGHIVKNELTQSYVLDEDIKDIGKFVYRISQEGEPVSKNNLKQVLEKYIPNKEAENQYNYLSKKLEFLTEEKYLFLNGNGYSITEKGKEARKNILEPRRELLNKKISYLKKLDLIRFKEDGNGYEVTEKYHKYKEEADYCKENKIERESAYISKEICNHIEKTLDNVDVGKIERTSERLAKGKFLDDTYSEKEGDYKSIRELVGVSDIERKSIIGLGKVLAISGVEREVAKNIIESWNIRSCSNIDTDTIEESINKAFDHVEDNKRWGNEETIYKSEWDNIFKIFNIEEDKIPKWLYSKEFHQNHLVSNIHRLWKDVWGVLEKQRLQDEASAEMMKKQQNKQAALNNKSARKEQARKQKSSGFYKDEEELER